MFQAIRINAKGDVWLGGGPTDLEALKKLVEEAERDPSLWVFVLPKAYRDRQDLMPREREWFC